MDRRALLLSAPAWCGLAGCTRRRDTGPPELVFAFPASAARGRIYGEALAKFEAATPGVRVRPLPITGDDYYGKLLVLMAAGDAPDVLWMGMGFGEFAQRGVFLDLDERVRAEPALAPDRFLREVVDWYRFGGRLYGFPFGVDMDFVVYNEALFDAAGVSYPAEGWTTEDLVEKARALTLDRNGDGRPEQWGYRGGLSFEPFGAALLTPDGTTPAVDSPEMRRYLQFSLDLIHRWRVSPAVLFSDLDEQEAMVAFQGGKTAMFYGHTWLMPDLRKRLAGMRWNIAPPPAAPHRAHWGSSQGFCISRATRHPDLAWKLMRHLLTSDALWPLADHVVPVNRRLMDRMVEEYGRGRPDLRVLRRGAGRLRADARVANLSEIRSLYGSAFDRVLSRRATPEVAMRQAAVSIREVLSRRN